MLGGPPAVLLQGTSGRRGRSRRPPPPPPLLVPRAALWGRGGRRAGHIWDSLDPGFAISEAPHPGVCDQDLGGSMERWSP